MAPGPLDVLPSFNAKNRELYARWQKGADQIAPMIELAASEPRDVATLEGVRHRMERGLLWRKTGDAVETTGLCAAQVGACAFFPVLLTGSAPAILAAGGAAFGGMMLIVAGILVTSRHRGPEVAIISGKRGAEDVRTLFKWQEALRNGGRQELEGRRRVAEATASFQKTLEKVAAPASDPPQVVRGPQYVDLGGIRIPVKESPPAAGRPGGADTPA